MKTLSGPAQAAFTGSVSRPVVLAQVAFGSVRRWSSRSGFTWNSQTWTAIDMRVENLRVDAFTVAGVLVLGNGDGVAGALVLAEGVQDRAITLWTYDAAATGAADVVWLCDAVGAAAEVTAREVRITLRHRSEFVPSPRTRVDASAGFRQLLPVGTVLRINGLAYTLERGN